jgi:hypothetical protein
LAVEGELEGPTRGVEEIPVGVRVMAGEIVGVEELERSLNP